MKIPNRLYFVNNIFDQCRWLQSVLGKDNCLKLADCSKFNDIFQNAHSEEQENKPEQTETELEMKVNSLNLRHTFDLETRRDHFPNQSSFHAFKKQKLV